MVKDMATYFSMTLGAFVFWQSMDEVHVRTKRNAGYIRVLMNRFAFAQCFSNKQLFSVLYFISFVCDGVDGWCARKFNQGMRFCVSCDMSFYWRSMSFMHIHTCTTNC
nr:probable CDP-diacylglycerol--inositol 3-phosphatidyltransferase 2 isoform X1 [Malus domestica]